MNTIATNCGSTSPSLQQFRSRSERIHVSPGFGVGALRIKSGDSDPRSCSALATLKRHKIPTPNPKDTSTVRILAQDLGKSNTMCCFFDTKTRKHSFLNAPTERNYLNTLFKNHEIDLDHGSVRPLRLDQRSGHQPRPENSRLLDDRTPGLSLFRTRTKAVSIRRNRPLNANSKNGFSR